MRKSEMLLEISKNLGAKGSLTVPEKLWGYGQISYDESKCIGCGKCETNCSEEAITFERTLDLAKVMKGDIKIDENSSKKEKIISLIKMLAISEPKNPIPVPDLVEGYGTVVIDLEKCIGCGNCERHCTANALKVRQVLEV